MDARFRNKQKTDFDKRHRAQELPLMPDNTPIWIQTYDGPISGHVVTKAEMPRSYVFETPSGLLQRNRHQLQVDPETDSSQGNSEGTQEPLAQLELTEPA